VAALQQSNFTDFDEPHCCVVAFVLHLKNSVSKFRFLDLAEPLGSPAAVR
jgi:hypothetical protein